ncbi:hypothetical protein [Sphingobacterium sp. UDSM-2020]|uniref:hypothetical protein n=1 Tax=Sphingobacterium sp. UDSM-2020 TaxID=2795738 RepID=UPI00193731E0|nr:hypothetical protein [Sphingobacterium sp. UDSM-2020]QQD16181.1 hypothetical protein JAZ75_11945 [Sphingobacterium sp. UDSM-2020]
MNIRNKINMIFRNVYSTSFILAYASLLTVSCSKKSDSLEKTITIIPNVIAIKDYSNQIIKLSNSKKATNQINTRSSLIKTVYFDNIAADISLTNEVETIPNTQINQTVNQLKSKNSASLSASNIIISPKTYYRFMLFDNRQQWDSWAATWTVSGTTNNWVTSNRNVTYNWYAGSYNQEKSLPSLTYDQTTMPMDDVTSEFMAASGKVTTSLQNNYVNFTFQRKTAALTFIFDARKMKSKIIDISLSPVDKTVLKGGTFNLATDQIESLKNPTVSTLDNSKWNNYNISSGDSVKVASFYTLGTTDITNFEIQLDKIVLQNFSDAQNPKTHTHYNKKMQLPITIKPTAGQRNTFTITLREL